MKRKLYSAFAKWHYAPILLGVALAAISATRLLGLGRDYVGGYDEMFRWARELPSVSLLSTFPNHELGFGLMLYMMAQIYSWPDWAFLFFIGCIFISIKLWCFYRYSPNFVVAFLGYLSLSFVVHDYTQLRAGSAIAFLMLASCLFLVEKRKISSGVLSIGAVSLHVSTVVALPFVVAFAYFMPAFYGLGVASLMPGIGIEFLSDHNERVAFYVAKAKDYQSPNPFSSLKLYQYGTVALFLYFRKEIVKRGWVLVELAGWFLIVGLLFFFGAIHIPVLAHRFSELFISFMPFLMAGISVLLARKWAVAFVSVGVLIGFWGSYGILQ